MMWTFSFVLLIFSAVSYTACHFQLIDLIDKGENESTVNFQRMVETDRKISKALDYSKYVWIPIFIVAFFLPEKYLSLVNFLLALFYTILWEISWKAIQSKNK